MLYTLKFSTVKICDIPLGIILGICVVSYYVYMSNNTENFTSDRKIKVYNFNTSWCGWSRKFQPEWDAFTNTIETSSDADKYDIRDIKCDDMNDLEIKNLSSKYKVPGYPYIIIDKDDKAHSYEGARTSDALVEYVKNL